MRNRSERFGDSDSDDFPRRWWNARPTRTAEGRPWKFAWRNDGDPAAQRNIARAVITDDGEVERIVGHAEGGLRRVSDLQSFADATTRATPESLTSIVEALYFHLKNDLHFTYSAELGYDEGKKVRWVRLPGATVYSQRRTCIDLVVLFMSCLANAKLSPIYIHLLGDPNHSLAGVWIGKPDPDFERTDLRTLNRLISDGRILTVECCGFCSAVLEQDEVGARRRRVLTRSRSRKLASKRRNR